jgi:hypothetical protein
MQLFDLSSLVQLVQIGSPEQMTFGTFSLDPALTQSDPAIFLDVRCVVLRWYYLPGNGNHQAVNPQPSHHLLHLPEHAG